MRHEPEKKSKDKSYKKIYSFDRRLSFTMALQKLEALTNVPFAFVKYLLTFTGFWPFLTPFQIFIRTLIINVGFVTLFIAQIITIALMEFNMEKSLDIIAYLSTSTCLCAVYYAGLVHKEAGFHLLERMIDDYCDLEGTKEYKILIKYATLCKFCIMMFIVSYLSYTSLAFLYLSKPVFLDIILPLNETRPRALLYPLDWLIKNEKHFMKMLFFEYIIILLMGASAISNLSAYLIFLQHICAMFRIIGCLLDNILEDKEKQLYMLDDHVVYAKIIRIIGFHSRTIEFMDILNAKFNTAYLIVVMCALCFTGVCITQLLREKEKIGLSLLAIPIVMYIISHLVWVFIFCYIGQHLEDVSSIVFDKTYGTPWYLMSKRSRILLLFMIARASKPSNVSIGKLFIASHEFFTGLMRLAVSSATVLYSLN